MSKKLTAEKYRRELIKREGREDLRTNYLYNTTLKRYAALVDYAERTTDDAARLRAQAAADRALTNLIAIERGDNR